MVPYPPTADPRLNCIFSTICGFIDERVLSCRASKLPVLTFTPASPPGPFWCVITQVFAFSSHLWIARLRSPGSQMSIYLSDNLQLVNGNHGTTDLSHEERKQPTNSATLITYVKRKNNQDTCKENTEKTTRRGKEEGIDFSRLRQVCRSIPSLAFFVCLFNLI